MSNVETELKKLGVDIKSYQPRVGGQVAQAMLKALRNGTDSPVGIKPERHQVDSDQGQSTITQEITPTGLGEFSIVETDYSGKHDEPYALISGECTNGSRWATFVYGRHVDDENLENIAANIPQENWFRCASETID
jgi:hypothetical protein